MTADTPPAAAQARSRVERFLPVIGFAALGVIFWSRLTTTYVDLDLYHQMSLARATVALGHLPDTDLWAFTPTIQPLVHHEWGAGLLAYAIATTFGGAGILALKYVVGLATLAFCVWTALRGGARWTTMWALALIATVLMEQGYATIRAHAYSFLFAAALLHLIERHRAGQRRALWAAAPLFVVWVNLHGGVAIGLFLVAAYALECVLERRPITDAVVLGVAAVALLSVNPYGVRYYSYMAKALTMDRSLIQEWDPIWAGTVASHTKFAFAGTIAFAAYAAAFGRRTPSGTALLAVLGILAARHVRILPFYAVVWLTYIPGALRGTALDEVFSRAATRRPWASSAVFVGAASMAVFVIASTTPLHLEVPTDPDGRQPGRVWYPAGAVRYLQATRFRGKVLTSFNDGAYVSWKLYPDVKVSMDSRYEAAYPDEVAAELMRLYADGTGIDAVVGKYQPDLILVPRGTGLSSAPIPWPVAYEDRAYVLYERPGLDLPSVRPIAASDEFP